MNSKQLRFHGAHPKLYIAIKIIKILNALFIFTYYSDSDEETSPLQSREPTKAEILEEMTLALRKAMTEILLEVTNEEISGVGAEVLKSETNKKSKHSVRKSGLQGKL